MIRAICKRTLIAIVAPLLASVALPATASAVYQWSVAMPGAVSVETGARSQAYLWVPPHCESVRAIVLAQHNLLEEPLLEAPSFRKVLSRLCVGEVWVTPMFDPVFDFAAGTGQRIDATMRALADESGYSEIAAAPIVPVGHSAAASFPWNFAAWAPQRTLALVSLKGDAPQTTLSGSGKPNPPWPARGIAGVPALMVMGEYEWLEPRLSPALAYRREHPDALISLYADAGHGHFDLSEPLIAYIGRFIATAVEKRSPRAGTKNLRAIAPESGWLADRWRGDRAPLAPPARAGRYRGPVPDSFWYFDAAMARIAQAHYRRASNKRPQLLGFVQDGATVPQTGSHAQVELAFEPQADGVTFKLGARYLDRVPSGHPNPARWTGLPVGAAIEHAQGPIAIDSVTGPVVRTGSDSWTLAFNRVGFDNQRRRGDVWFVATQAGDGVFKSAVQQALLRVPFANTVGRSQTVAFTLPQDASLRRTPSLPLNGVSDSGLAVRYYVKQGPAWIEGSRLRFEAIPKSARRPIKVTVVAWQYGLAGKVKTAAPVERTLYLRD